MRVCMGGTFDVIHAGHRALLRRAFDAGDEVFIGLTTDEMALRERERVSPWSRRKRNLQALLRRRGWKGYRIAAISDAFGEADEGDYDAIVVSADRTRVADAINRARAGAGLRPLDIEAVPMVTAEDGLPITARRIRAGETDREGRLRVPVRARVGSDNPVKVAAVRNVVSRIYRRVVVKGVAVASGVPDQPLDGRTAEGAVNRAKAARRDAHFGVGIEAGLLWSEAASDYLDVQYCAVVDRGDRVTVGHGPGFQYPREVITEVKAGKSVGEAMAAIAGDVRIGRGQGAIGYLSKGRMNRTQLTETAVLMAFLPRIRRELYTRR